jgi:hypothetical protein
MSQTNPVPNSHAEHTDQPTVIRSVALPANTDSKHFLIVLLIAWLISGLVHAVILSLFLFVTVNTGRAVSLESETVQTQIDDEKPSDANLTNDDFGGLDPEDKLNFNVNRIEQVSVPGPVNPTEAPGIKDMPEGAPFNVPPPPGLGNNQGLASGLDAPKNGLASPFGDAPGGVLKGMIAGGFSGRSGATKEQLIREGGGNTESEAAVASGIKWIVEHQSADGHWSLDGFNLPKHCNCDGFGRNDDIAGTALGLLPLLGAGETHRNPKSIYRHNVQRALDFLTRRQARDGNFGGDMYSHGLATIAICEAYAMTSDPKLKASAQRAVAFIRAGQSENGGWRYYPRSGGDTSVTGWEIMALKSGQMAGLDVDDSRNPTLSRASKFLNSVMTADQTGYGYQSASEVSECRTAIGLLCRLYLGTGPRNTGIIGGVKRLQAVPPSPATKDIYYYYYATQVMHHVGDAAWDQWNPRMRNLLVSAQDKGMDPKHRHLKGSWSPKGDIWAMTGGGRLMSTSLAVLTLEVYYRHLPLYRRDLGGKVMAAN